MDDVQIRLECVKLAAGLHRLPHVDDAAVVKTSTALYNFVAQPAATPQVGSKAGDKSKRTP